MFSLLNAPQNKVVKVVSIVGGRGARKILAQLGVGVGSTIKIRRNAPFEGPLLIEIRGTSIAVGRGIASKIMVEDI